MEKNQKPKYDIFSIRCSTDEKEELQKILKEAEIRLNKGKVSTKDYKIRKNDIALHVLRKFVVKLKSSDF